MERTGDPALRTLLPLLAAALAACATAAPPPPAAGGPAAAGPIADGPFRLRVDRVWALPGPDAEVTAGFGAELLPVEGTRFPAGRWFFEGARLGEDVLLPGHRWIDGHTTVGEPAGYSPRFSFFVDGLHPGESTIRRLAVDVPMIEILEGSEEAVSLGEGAEVTREVGGLSVRFSVSDGGLWYLESSEDDNATRTFGFYCESARPVEHAWDVRDAHGRVLIRGAGGGDSVANLTNYMFADQRERDLALPIRITFRIPRRWRVTMQRFVLEDVHLEPAPTGPETGEKPE